MIDRTQDRLGLKPERLAADTAYGSAANLGWLVNDKKITPHIPVIDKSKRNDGTLSRADFTFDAERNVYVCPQDKLLTTPQAVFIVSERYCTGPASSPAIRVCLNGVAVLARRSARSRGTLMRMPTTSSDRWPAPQPSSDPGTSASGLRCCLPISSASSSLAGCDCADPVERRMSSSSPPPPRTSANLPSSDQNHPRPSSQHDPKVQLTQDLPSPNRTGHAPTAESKKSAPNKSQHRKMRRHPTKSTYSANNRQRPNS